jgi:hypothetical protein
MPETYHTLRVDADEIDLVYEGLEALRLYCQGFSDREGRFKVREIKRLEKRIEAVRRRRERRLGQLAPARKRKERSCETDQKAKRT